MVVVVVAWSCWMLARFGSSRRCCVVRASMEEKGEGRLRNNRL